MSYIFNANTDTPEGVARRRKLAEIMAGNAMSRAPQNVGEGLQAVGNAIMYRQMMGRADRSERAGRESAAQAWNAAFGGGSQHPAAPPAIVDGAGITPTPDRQNSMTMGSPARAPGQGGGMPDMQTTMGLLSNPYLSDAQRQVAGAMLESHMRQQDPSHQLDMEYRRAQIDQLRNPRQEDTAAMQNYEFLVAQGVDPETAMSRAFSGGTTVNVGGDGAPGLGKLSADYGYVLDPQTRQPVIDPTTGLPTAAPVPGSPAAREIEAGQNAAAQAGTNQATSANVVLQDINRIRDRVANAPWYSPGVGMGAGIMRRLEGTTATDVGALTETVKANIGFDRLQQMRDASPTGGALGQVTERELATLQAVLGSLDQSQSEEQFLQNLDRLGTIYQGIVEKAAAYPNAAQFGFGPVDAAQPAGDMPADFPDPALWELLSPEDRALWLN